MNEIVLQREVTPATMQMLSVIVKAAAGVSQVKQAEYARKILFAYENNLPLSAGVSGGVFVVNDKIEVEGIIWRSKIKQHPTYDYQIAELTSKHCTMIAFDGDKEIGRITYDEGDAKVAGLLAKDNWKKHPKDMYLNKASARLGRYFMPDLFNMPVYVRGEISGDDVKQEPVIVNQQKDTFQLLVDEFGHDAVLNAMQQCNGDVDAMVAYFEEEE